MEFHTVCWFSCSHVLESILYYMPSILGFFKTNSNLLISIMFHLMVDDLVELNKFNLIFHYDMVDSSAIEFILHASIFCID